MNTPEKQPRNIPQNPLDFFSNLHRLFTNGRTPDSIASQNNPGDQLIEDVLKESRISLRWGIIRSILAGTIVAGSISSFGDLTTPQGVLASVATLGGFYFTGWGLYEIVLAHAEYTGATAADLTAKLLNNTPEHSLKDK